MKLNAWQTQNKIPTMGQCKLDKTIAIKQNNLLSLGVDKVVRFLEGESGENRR
jgi:hypothetical protein